MTENDHIAFAVKEMAAQLFFECGAADDFCIQSVGAVIVFGGTNRVILSEHGWRLVESHCTERFIEAFRKWIGQPTAIVIECNTDDFPRRQAE